METTLIRSKQAKLTSILFIFLCFEIVLTLKLLLLFSPFFFYLSTSCPPGQCDANIKMLSI